MWAWLLISPTFYKEPKHCALELAITHTLCGGISLMQWFPDYAGNCKGYSWFSDVLAYPSIFCYSRTRILASFWNALRHGHPPSFLNSFNKQYLCQHKAWGKTCASPFLSTATLTPTQLISCHLQYQPPFQQTRNQACSSIGNALLLPYEAPHLSELSKLSCRCSGIYEGRSLSRKQLCLLTTVEPACYCDKGQKQDCVLACS